MASRVSILHWVIVDIGVPIQRLRVDWPTPMQFVGIRALAIQRGDEARLVKGHRQRAQRHAVHATAGIPWHHGIRANEPANRRVVIPHIIEQQAGALQPLPGVVERCTWGVARTNVAPRPKLLLAIRREVPIGIGNNAHVAETVAVNVGECAVALMLCDDMPTEAIQLALIDANRVFPHAEYIHYTVVLPLTVRVAWLPLVS